MFVPVCCATPAKISRRVRPALPEANRLIEPRMGLPVRARLPNLQLIDRGNRRRGLGAGGRAASRQETEDEQRVVEAKVCLGHGASPLGLLTPERRKRLRAFLEPQQIRGICSPTWRSRSRCEPKEVCSSTRGVPSNTRPMIVASFP